MEEGLLIEEELLVKEEEGQRSCAPATARCASDFKAESGRLGCIAGPMVAVMLSQFLLQLVSMMIVGHVGELALAGAAIASSLTNVTGFSLLAGMAGALETLCGQSYGAEQYQSLASNTYGAMITLVLTCLPLSLIWVSMERILSFTGQDPQVSHEAGRYSRWMIPGLIAYAICQPLMRFLLSQSLILPMLLSSTMALCIHIPLCWTLVFKSGLSNTGAALAISVSHWVNVIILGLYVKYSKSCKKTRFPFSWDAIRRIKGFFSLAVPSAIMVCLQWWSFELLILMSGLLPNPQLETSVLSICLSTLQVLYCFPYAFGAAVSTRISNELGAGNPERARLSMLVVVSLAIIEVAIVSGTLYAMRNILGYAFSGDKEVVGYVTQLVPFVCMSVIMDCLQGVLSGVSRGCGWQHLGAYANLGALYIIGVPAAIILGFLLHLEGKGLWIGILSGAMTQTILLFMITGFTDWQKQANDARKRVLEGNGSIG